MVSVTRRDALTQILEMQVDRLGGDVQPLGDLTNGKTLLVEGRYLLSGGQ
jgi:hypothetical protein